MWTGIRASQIVVTTWVLLLTVWLFTINSYIRHYYTETAMDILCMKSPRTPEVNTQIYPFCPAGRDLGPVSCSLPLFPWVCTSTPYRVYPYCRDCHLTPGSSGTNTAEEIDEEQPSDIVLRAVPEPAFIRYGWGQWSTWSQLVQGHHALCCCAPRRATVWTTGCFIEILI